MENALSGQQLGILPYLVDFHSLPNTLRPHKKYRDI